MGKFIVKLKDMYFEYSTIPDAPVTWGMNLETFKEYYKIQYGDIGMRKLEERLRRVEDKGTSSFRDGSAEEVLMLNRAGPDETELTPDEIYQAYCERKPIRNGWIAK